MSDNAQPMMTVNMELVDKVFKHLHERNNWNQRGWVKRRDSDWDNLDVIEFFENETASNSECGFTMCFGGWACVISGNVKKNNMTYDRVDPTLDGRVSDWFLAAAHALGFNPFLAELVFFNFSKDLDEFEREVRELIARYGNMTRTEAMRAYHNREQFRSEYTAHYLFNYMFKDVGGDEEFNEEDY